MDSISTDELFKTYNPLFTERTPHLHSMLVNCGHECRRRHTYDLSGLKRGNREFAVWQYTLDGMGEFRLGRTIRAVPAGFAFLAVIPEDHEYRLPPQSSHWEFCYVSFSGMEPVRLIREFRRHHGSVAAFSPDSRPVKMLMDLLGKPEEFRNRFVMSAFAYRFALSLFEDAGESALSPQEEFRRRIHDFCLAHIDRPLDVSELAREAGCSRWHFTRLFQEAEGIPPHQFVTELKMRLAVRLLQTTPGSVKEIAASCGYEDVSYFCKVFKRIYETTPAQFRIAAEPEQ